MPKEKIVIAAIKPWNIDNGRRLRHVLKSRYDVVIIRDRKALTYGRIRTIRPIYLFFPHWSWMIPREIYENYKCIVFHMTDVPYGRGGSPLQNLISRRIYDTKISAIRAGEEYDAGGVYLKSSLNLRSGNAEDIYRKASKIVFFQMIPRILKTRPAPRCQRGKVVTFRRRTPAESDIMRSRVTNIADLYDFIRMLDAEGYPKAFVKKGTVKIDFSGIIKRDNKVTGKFEATYEKK